MMRARHWIVSLAVLLGALGVGLAHGPTPIGLLALARAIWHPGPSLTSVIVWQIRMPRVLAAALVGGGLAGAGVLMQALLRNPLADPYVVGASAGAGLGAILTEEFLGGLAAGGAFVGAMAAVFTAFLLARGRGTVQVLTLILAGYAVGVILSAVSLFLMLMNRRTLSTIFAWEVGGIHGMTWGQVGLAATLIGVGLVLAFWETPAMNALLLGEDQARHLGVSVERTQFLILLWASLMTGAAVYLSGLIGFVGLVVPHVVRRRVGPDHRRLLPLAFIWGASFLVLADTLAESIPGIGTVPVGLITAFLGGPYFLWLLVRTQREGVSF